ncbi:MAG: hydroxymethylbilane synthase [Actinomycetota bacterium]
MTTLRIATRRSALALAQAEEVAALLSENAFRSEIVPMSTSGDEGVAPLETPAGRKGLWVDRILDALRTGEVDIAVHSAKDLPAEDEEGIVIAAVPKRADPLDVLIGREEKLPPGLVIGTSSVRRRAQLLAHFPGMGVTEIRGNVDTRLRKLAEGEVDGLVLAAAGLARLGIEPPHARRLRVDEMVPAPGQGSLAVQAREEDRTTRAVVSVLDHLPSRRALEAERALVQLLGGGCDLPLGALAATKGDRIRMVGLVATPDGAKIVRSASESDDPGVAASILAQRLRADGADRILAELEG